MTKFRVTMLLDQDDLMELINSGGIAGATITPVPDEMTVDDIHRLHPAPKTKLPRAPRTPRPSKVSEALINALADGPQNTGKLKEALVKANLAAGSLSSGVAQLLKSGQIERADGGMYSLPTRKAAE